MPIKLIIISANEIRHKFFRRQISKIEGVKLKLCLAEKNKTRQFYQINKSSLSSKNQKKHFQDRIKSEKKYFSNFIKKNKEVKNLLLIDRGEFNYNSKIIKRIYKIKPDLIVSYGCSIIKEMLISKYKNKFVNIHLGLSPYYRGSATNFWPFVYNKLQFLGVTFMKIDNGIDTGPILHQFRPQLALKDTVHDVGNKLIMKMTEELKKVILNLKKIKPINQNKKLTKKIFKKKHFSEKSLLKLKENQKKNIIKKYIINKKKIDKKYPIIEMKI
jgi:phosphoribosylglycinamide formyltransferase 1